MTVDDGHDGDWASVIVSSIVWSAARNLPDVTSPKSAPEQNEVPAPVIASDRSPAATRSATAFAISVQCSVSARSVARGDR
ncbi:MAG: hypothetical protein R2710_06985 [Acidimicrobiales bacterium]